MCAIAGAAVAFPRKKGRVTSAARVVLQFHASALLSWGDQEGVGTRYCVFKYMFLEITAPERSTPLRRSWSTMGWWVSQECRNFARMVPFWFAQGAAPRTSASAQQFIKKIGRRACPGPSSDGLRCNPACRGRLLADIRLASGPEARAGCGSDPELCRCVAIMFVGVDHELVDHAGQAGEGEIQCHGRVRADHTFDRGM